MAPVWGAHRIAVGAVCGCRRFGALQPKLSEAVTQMESNIEEPLATDDIAGLTCGFSSGSHFSTAYGALFSITPREERQL